MAKIRSVHPEICIDDLLPQVTANAERTFVRLWTHLDDDGRGLDDPRLLKAALYPLHDNTVADVDHDLEELANVGLLIRYEANGRRYLSAKPPAWARWQKPRWRKDSKLPPPPDACASDARPTGDGDPPQGPPDSVSDSAETERDDTNSNSVGHASDVSPTDVRRVTAQVVEGVGVGVGEVAAAARNNQTLDVEQRRQLIHQAIEHLTDRHLDRHPTTGNAERHRAAVTAGKLKDHHHRGHELLVASPTLTSVQLADQLEPDTAPPAPLTSLDDLVPANHAPIEHHGPQLGSVSADASPVLAMVQRDRHDDDEPGRPESAGERARILAQVRAGRKNVTTHGGPPEQHCGSGGSVRDDGQAQAAAHGESPPPDQPTDTE